MWWSFITPLIRFILIHPILLKLLIDSPLSIMIRTKIPGRNPKKVSKAAVVKDKKGFCHYVVYYGSISLVLLWFLFLIYIYESGLITEKQLSHVPTVSEVQNVMRDVETSLLIKMGGEGAVPSKNAPSEPQSVHIGNSINNVEDAPISSNIQSEKIHGERAEQRKNRITKRQEKISQNSDSTKKGDYSHITDSFEYKIVPGYIEGQVHVIFSTDCSTFQDWQSLVLFHSAKTVRQNGPVTRIASGCDDEKKASLTNLYKKLYPDYHVHFTPDFMRDKTGKKYAFYNKPYGLEHWLEYADPPIPDHTIIALLDPDMIFLRPITTQVKGLVNILHDRRVNKNTIQDVVERGKPVAQLYGLGAPWGNDRHKNFNRTYVCGANSPCLKGQEGYLAQHYAVGPPYIAEKYDFYKIARSWTDFVPRVYEGYPYLLAEMYAYAMGAAHESLPHFQLEHMMVSNTEAGGEGWPHVDLMDSENVCTPPDANGIFFPDQKVPTVMHFCQFYRAGDLGFQKRRVPKGIFSCDHPMLMEPPLDLGVKGYRIRNGVVSLMLFAIIVGYINYACDYCVYMYIERDLKQRAEQEKCICSMCTSPWDQCSSDRL